MVQAGPGTEIHRLRTPSQAREYLQSVGANARGVTAGTPSDPYLMYGYDRKELQLSHAHESDVTFTVEVDFLGDGTWRRYGSFTVAPGGYVHHEFPKRKEATT